MSHRLLWVLVAAVPLWLLGTAAGYFFLVHVLSFPEWAAGICAAVGAIASGMGLAYGAVQAQRGLRGSHGATEEAGQLFAALLGVAAICLGVAVALGTTALPGQWSRLALFAVVAAGWVLWELLMRNRRRHNGDTVRVPSKDAQRLGIGVTVLIGLFVAIAIAAGWISL
jgi:hypothetical protein